MKTIDLSIKIGFGTFDELSADDQHLIQTAIAATENSYSPYSRFRLGLLYALPMAKKLWVLIRKMLLSHRDYVLNVLQYLLAQSNYPDQPVTALAIAARNEHGLMHDPIVPCGACRQVILEIEDRYKQPIRILLYGTGGVYVINTVKELLPLQFVSESMK